VLGTLVTYAQWPEEMAEMIESAILEVPALHGALAKNKNLCESTWFCLYPAKPLPAAKRAVFLVDRELSAGQLEYAAGCETRSSIFDILMERGGMSLANQTRLAAGKGLSVSTATKLMEAPGADPELVAKAAKRVGGRVLVTWLSRSSISECPTDEAWQLLADWGSGDQCGTWKLHRAFEVMCERRADLIGFAAYAGIEYYNLIEAACSSSQLGVSGQAGAVLGVIADGLAREWSNETPNHRARSMYDRTLAALVTNFCVGGDILEKARALYNLYCSDDTAMYSTWHALDDRSEGPFANTWVQGRVEDVNDRSMLGALVDEYYCDNPFVTLALAKNPNLGDLSAIVARRLGDLACSSVVLAKEYEEACDAFFCAHPELVSMRRERKEEPRKPRVVVKRGEGKPVWLNGDLGEPSNLLRYGRARPVTVKPRRYPVSLGLVASMYSADQICGVVTYLVGRLGTELGAWRAFFALSGDLAGSDLDTLIDAAMALTF
jgi:hypothetical protein